MQDATKQDWRKRIARHLAQKTTDVVGDFYRNDVATYCCPTQLSSEQVKLFRDKALVVGLSCDLPKAGDYLTHDATGVPILVTRDKAGQLHAFLNMCRHRATRLAEGAGHCRGRFVCPYHAWSYALDGRLVAQPAAQQFAGLNGADRNLVQLPIKEAYGLIWVLPKVGGDIDLDDQLGDLAADLAALKLEQYHHFETRYMRQPMNWKLVIDTFLELYHIPSLHKATIADKILGEPALFDHFGYNSRIVGVRHSYLDSAFASELSGEAANDDLMAHLTVVDVIFPNTVIIHQVDHIEIFRVHPIAGKVNESEMFISLYAPDAIGSEAARLHWQKNMDLLLKVTETEDFMQGQGIQIAVEAGGQPALIFGRNEPGLQHFHKSVRLALTE